VCITQKFLIKPDGGPPLKGYLLMDEDEHGNLLSVNVELSKEGSMSRALIHAVVTCINRGLEFGMPLSIFVDEFRGWRFEPSGPVECSGNVNRCESVADYIARELEARYIPRSEATCTTN
jgi:ribonucleoside-diphosphate reductase alpha chain